MKPLHRLLALVSFAFCVAASVGCGGEAGRSNAPAQPGKSAATAGSVAEADVRAADSGSASIPHYPGVPAYPGDSDGDADHNSDENMNTPGREGSTADRRSIAAVIKRYYETALAGDGSKACAMLAAPLVKSIPLEYGRFGAPGSRASSCPVIMSAFFKQERRQVVAVARTQKLIDVRLEGNHGYAALHVQLPCLRGSCVLDVRTIHIANVLIRREGVSWKIDSRLAIV